MYALSHRRDGQAVGKVGPATAFGRPPADGTARARLLVAFTRKLGAKGAEATFTVTPYDIDDAGARRQAARAPRRRRPAS